jgi:ribosomal protein S18 acetylase RimI-like enzyme
MAPGRPPLAHQGAGHVAQPHGGNGSFEIDPVQLGLARGGGKPLPKAVLAKMEAAFGADFSAVRVHVGPQASRIGAVAFTTGNDLYFAPGQFQPDSVKGQQLIGHELAHVIQQRTGRVRAPASGIAVVQDRALEAEADRLGMRAAAHRPPVQAKVAPSDGAGAVRVSQPIPEPGGWFRVSAGASGREVGSLRVHPGERTAEVTDLGVDPAYREQGLGKQLLARAARTGLALGKSRVALHAEDKGSGRLTRWYKSMGFVQTGTNARGLARLEAPAWPLLAGAMQPKAAHPQHPVARHGQSRSIQRSAAPERVYFARPARLPQEVWDYLLGKQAVKAADVQHLIQSDYVTCKHCNKLVAIENTHVDHWPVPWVRLTEIHPGGIPESVAFDRNNLQLLCGRCNSSDRHNVEQRQTRNQLSSAVAASINNKLNRMGQG